MNYIASYLICRKFNTPEGDSTFTKLDVDVAVICNGYMKNEKNASPNRSGAGCYLREEHNRKPGRHPRRKQRLLVWIAVASAVILLVVSVLCVCFRTDRLTGIWHYDGVTAYQFDGRGNGKLILPDKEYPFCYKIADGKLSIDFESEAARDTVYGYALDENQLTLVKGIGDTSVTYILTK